MAIDGTDYIRTVKEGSHLYFQYAVNGIKSFDHIPYDPAQHRWWRIRHDESSNLIYWETSPDSVTWTEHMRWTPTIKLTTVMLEMSAGSWDVDAYGTAVFDNLRFAAGN